MIKKIFSIPGLIVLTLILVVGYLGLWMYLRSAVTSGVSNYISELESEGYEVNHGGISIDGFPFSINAQSPNFSVSTTPNSIASQSGPWSVETDTLRMNALTHSPLSWSLQHTGNMQINTQSGAFDLTPANVSADLVYSMSGSMKSIRADLGQSQINGLHGTNPPILGFDSLRTDIDVKSGTAIVYMQAKNVRYSPQLIGHANGLLGPDLTLFSMKSEIENWPLLEGEGLDVWMQSTATVKSDDWQLKWGNLDLVGGYDLEFKNGLPEGIVRFRVKNIEALLKNLTDLNLLDSSFAAQINAVAAGMKSDEDGRKLIELTIRDGVVKYGFFTLFRL